MTGILSHEEIQRLLRVTPADTPAGPRNRALLVALFADGRAIKETLELSAAEADWEKFAPAYREEIDAWLARRDELGLKRFGPLFSSLKGEPLTASYVRNLIKRARAKAAKLPDEPGPGPEEEVSAAPAEPEPPPPPAPPEPEPEPPPEPEPEAADIPAPQAPGPPPPPREPVAPPPFERRPPERPPTPSPPPPRPPWGGFLGGRSPLALGAVALGAVLLAGGIAAAVALTRDSKSSTSSSETQKTESTESTQTATTGESTRTHTTSTGTTASTSTGTTTRPTPGGGTLVFVPDQSYCQLQAHRQLGFWITLQSKGSKDVNVDLVAVETYGGEDHANPKIQGITVPANAPRLQTVVSYRLPASANVTACSLRIFSPEFAKSGETLTIKVKAAG